MREKGESDIVTPAPIKFFNLNSDFYNGVNSKNIFDIYIDLVYK